MVPGLAELTRLAQERAVALPPPLVRRRIREAANISQPELGHVLGVTATAICRYEAGVREPRGELRTRYIEALEELRHAV